MTKDEDRLSKEDAEMLLKAIQEVEAEEAGDETEISSESS